MTSETDQAIARVEAWDRLEALAKAATPGRWFWEKDGGDFRRLRAPCRDATGIDEYVLRPDHDYHRDRDEIDCEEEDAAFIAAANPETILRLLSLARQVGGLREGLSSLLGFVGQMTCEEFIDALYALKTPGLEITTRDDLVINLDATLSRCWSSLALRPDQSNVEK